ncbi:hypothetical protein OROMI_000702 [Orobanche minor]
MEQSLDSSNSTITHCEDSDSKTTEVCDSECESGYCPSLPTMSFRLMRWERPPPHFKEVFCERGLLVLMQQIYFVRHHQPPYDNDGWSGWSNDKLWSKIAGNIFEANIPNADRVTIIRSVIYCQEKYFEDPQLKSFKCDDLKSFVRLLFGESTQDHNSPTIDDLTILKSRYENEQHGSYSQQVYRVGMADRDDMAYVDDSISPENDVGWSNSSCERARERIIKRARDRDVGSRGAGSSGPSEINTHIALGDQYNKDIKGLGLTIPQIQDMVNMYPQTSPQYLAIRNFEPEVKTQLLLSYVAQATQEASSRHSSHGSRSSKRKARDSG